MRKAPAFIWIMRLVKLNYENLSIIPYLQEKSNGSLLIARMISYVKLKYRLFIILISLLIAIVAAIGINPYKVGLAHDDGIYVILGKALSEGKGLQLINLPSSPYQTKYPIVYPFLISLVWPWVSFPQNIFWIKLINVAFLFLILLETYYISFALLDDNRFLATLVTLLVGTSTIVFHFSTSALSEIPYLFFSLTTLLLFLKAERQEATDKDNTRKYLFTSLGVVCASLAFQTRVVGLSLLLAFVLYCLMKKKNTTTAFVLFLFAALNLPWILWARTHSAGLDINPLLHYYTGYTQFLHRAFSAFYDVNILKTIIVNNMSDLYVSTSIVISNGSLAFKPLMAIVWVVLLVGIWKSLLDNRYLLVHLYLAVYFFQFIYIPFNPTSTSRYLVPLAPFLFLIFMRGIMTCNYALAGLMRSRRPLFYFRAFVFCVLFPNLVISIVSIGNVVFTKSYHWDGQEETIVWIKQHTDKDAIVAGVYDPVYYLYTGRVALRPWIPNETIYYYSSSDFAGDPDYSLNLLKELKVGYLIEEPLGGPEGHQVMKFLSEMIKRHGDELKLVFVSKDQKHKIYQIQYSQMVVVEPTMNRNS